VDELRVVGVYVGTPQVIGTQRGKPVRSAIGKRPVAAEELELTEVNLAGDRQADRVWHGGPDKAVYVYPAEHYQAWQTEAFALRPGGVGENVSTFGQTERTVRVGDVWQWGQALVQVSQPRSPCFRLGMHTGRKDIIPAMINSGRCGWYLRVLTPGTVPSRGRLRLIERDLASPTIAELYRATFGAAEDARPDWLREIAAGPLLADQWRAALLRKLAPKSSRK
jgi:MOSC domain-containing protein YiiM